MKLKKIGEGPTKGCRAISELMIVVEKPLSIIRSNQCEALNLENGATSLIFVFHFLEAVPLRPYVYVCGVGGGGIGTWGWRFIVLL
jgi:hypothetical protein